MRINSAVRLPDVCGFAADAAAGLQVPSGDAVLVRGDLGRRAGGHKPAALLAAARTSRSALTLRVYAQNTAACRFYAREGFTAVERTLDPDTGADELLLRWNA